MRINRRYSPPSTHRNGVQPLICPEAYPSFTTGTAASWPSCSGVGVPSPREQLLIFQMGWVKAGVPIRSTILPYQNLATPGTQTQRIRQAVFKMDSLWADGTNGGIHTTLLSPNLIHSTPMVLSDARTLGGNRIYKFPFDAEYTPVEDQPVILATAFELLYPGATDTAPTACLFGASQDSGIGNAQRWGHIGSAGSYIGRTYHWNTLLTANLSALDFNTYASPGVGLFSAGYIVSSLATATVSAKTITFNLALNLGWHFLAY